MDNGAHQLDPSRLEFPISHVIWIKKVSLLLFDQKFEKNIALTTMVSPKRFSNLSLNPLMKSE